MGRTPEIIIGHPGLNRDNFRSYSYDNQNDPEGFRGLLELNRVTPSTHPRAIDLCAGDGSFARMLVDNGWQEEDMTCVDIARTETPLVPKATWLFWDVEALSLAILKYTEIPPEIAVYKHRFDIAILMQGEGFYDEKENAVCKYLVRPNGYIHNLSTIIRGDT